jgi:hypothetical protein
MKRPAGVGCTPASAENFDLKMPVKKSKDIKARSQNEFAPGKTIALAWKDPKTGLEWQCQSPGEMSWHEALRYAESLVLDGKSDWRLPTVSELETLLDRSVLYYELRPIVREEIPFRDTLSYWSSTTFREKTNNAWIVMFDGAYVLSYYKSNCYHIRCVRGSQNAGEF